MKLPFNNKSATTVGSNVSSRRSRWLIDIVVIAIVGIIVFFVLHATKNQPAKTVVSSNAASTAQNSFSSEVSQDITNNNGKAALTLFNSQSAAIRNSQTGQLILASIYLSLQEGKQAVTTLAAVGNKYGWTSNLSLEIAQAAEVAGNTASAIQYNQQAITELQQQITNLTKIQASQKP